MIETFTNFVNMKSYTYFKTLFSLLVVVLLAAFMVDTVNAAPTPTARPNSRVVVEFRGIPPEDKANVDGGYTVSNSDGTIALPYLSGRIAAAGKTADQLQRIIEAEYKKQEIYANPIVYVQVGSEQEILAASQRYVQVSGYVARKANIPYRPDMTLFEAILECGDITDFGSRKIQVTRGNQTREYDYFSARHRNIKLCPNDSIVVQKRGPFETRPSGLEP